jgi:hypothetical protein
MSWYLRCEGCNKLGRTWFLADPFLTEANDFAVDDSVAYGQFPAKHRCHHTADTFDNPLNVDRPSNKTRPGAGLCEFSPAPIHIHFLSSETPTVF